MADIAMTGEGGASSTFRSIFGDQKKQKDDVLQLEHGQSDGGASGASHSSAVLATDDDDEALWNDEPSLDDSASASGNNSMLGLQFAQQRSMEEWADEDDEEEHWKDALQDRVNQLELSLQHRNDVTVADSRPYFDPQQKFAVVDTEGVESLSMSTRSLSRGLDVNRPRNASRHKMQRTSSLHACISSDNVITTDPQFGLWNCKVADGKVVNLIGHDSRSRATTVDFVARNIETVEHYRKRSGSVSGSSATKTNSPRHSLSLKKATNSNHSSPIQLINSRFRGTKAAGQTSSGAAVCHVSETEAIRRYVLDDVKNMSMERLVSDAQRLHFLENYYQNRQGPGATPAATTSTTVAPTSPILSLSPLSTS